MKKLLVLIFSVLAFTFTAHALVHDWKSHVPAQERTQANPYPTDQATVAAGAQIYAERCASCHGPNADGRGRRPSLRTPHVQDATDGELLWLLKNGELRYGMPSWSGLPEQQRWQVERYVKSLPLE